MREFRKLESKLRATRPEPRTVFLRDLVDAVRPAGSRRLVPRLGLATAVTTAFVVALAPAGGLGYAVNGVTHAATAVEHTMSAAATGHPATSHPAHSAPDTHPNEHPTSYHPTSGHHEYGVPICHHGHHGFVLLRVSDDVLATHLLHPQDIVPAPEHGCPH